MKCSNCARYKTKECYANPRGDDWDLAENYTCFVSREQQPLTRPKPATPHLSQPYIAREGHYTPEIRELNWFQRHLNWTWVFTYLIWIPLNASDDAFPPIIGGIFLLLVSGWVIKQKGRSLWWILLTPFFSPLWLKNKSLVSQRLPTITDEERQECLVYYEEEKKLRLLLERIGRLFDKSVRKYEDALSKSRRAREAIMDGVFDNLGKIYEVTDHIHQAAAEIVKRKREMKIAPSAASAMSSAWLAVYLDYEALRDPSNISAGYKSIEVQAKEARQKELVKKFNKSWYRALEEEKEFHKRLKVSSVEYQRIVDYAAIAVEADDWLRKLEAECS
ncbi:hypothetical protein ACFLYF_02685 [Chloroflexota bacterium]